jgi:hypothetical protein
MSSSNAGRHHEKVKIWFIPTLVAAAVLKKKKKRKRKTYKEALVTSCLCRMRVTVQAGSSGSLMSIHSSLVSLRRSAPVRVDVEVPAKLGAGESGTAPLPSWVNL